MEPKPRAYVPSDASPHKRTKSSVLKSIIPGNHRRKPSSDSIDPPYWNDKIDGKEGYMHVGSQSILPPDHPHTRQHLKENKGNGNPIVASPRKAAKEGKEVELTSRENQKMTRSASFKSFVGKEKEKLFQKEGETEKGNNMKPSKSSTSIAAFLSRPRSKGLKAEDAHGQKDKENQRPPSSAGMPPPPIWAQFATQGFEESPHTTKIPLNDRLALEEEVALYTPQDYSPSKQRNFPDYQQPTLPRKTESKPRPKSERIAAGPTPASFAETVSGMRKSGLNKSQVDVSNQTRAKNAVETGQNCLPEEKHLSERLSSVENRKVSNDSAGSNLPMPKHGSRVMAAVAAFNGKAKELPKAPPSDAEIVQLDPKTIESAFESLLVSKILRLLSGS